jgi:hypothetical protein
VGSSSPERGSPRRAEWRAKAVASKTDPTGPGVALLPAAAVYHTEVEDAVATKEHHDLVRSILETMWIPEYQTGEEI